ncbi:MAG: NuoF family protein, partial [Candidatus Brocadiia bacterium]
MNFDSIQRKANSAWQDFESPEHGRVLVGSGTCGRAAGAEDVLAAAREYDTDGLLDIYEVGCLGLCYAEPLVELSAPDMPAVLYGNLRPDQLPDLLSGYFDGADLQSDNAVAVMNGEQVEGIPSFDDLPMMRAQKRIVLENCGLTDPDSIDHYVARGGYSGLRAALQSSPDDVINEIKESGLRGRGGAGFPTGLKWQFCRQEQSDTRYLVCNADEGDPGAFMDRSLIEGDPHRVIEGILIAAHAIGASQAYVYIRAEYPLAIDRLEAAAEQAREMGLLGEDVLGSDLSVELELKKGAGAFVCGEETALLASLEGKRGQPQPRPPFPAQDGFKGHPTNINNVETLANVPSILRNGSDWFRRYGTEESPGTKTFALAGKVARTGLVEVPLGTKLGDIVQGAGGGVAEGAELKGVQTG